MIGTAQYAVGVERTFFHITGNQRREETIHNGLRTVCSTGRAQPKYYGGSQDGEHTHNIHHTLCCTAGTHLKHDTEANVGGAIA